MILKGVYNIHNKNNGRHPAAITKDEMLAPKKARKEEARSTAILCICAYFYPSHKK